ncbi:MAG: NAD(P)H-dependent glycerol-3-phosphate dehydrogenase [Bacteroidia bacterium]
MKVGLIGAGSWGCALAETICQKGHTLYWWVHQEDIAESLRKEAKHPLVFPHHKYPPQQIEIVTTEVQLILAKAQVILVALPSRYIHKVLSGVDLPTEKPWISATKGLLPENGWRPTEYLRSRRIFQVAVLSGPSYAEEVIQHRPTWVGLGTKTQELHSLSAHLFETEYFHLIPTDAITALEWVGILKNIYAIGIGAINLLGDNARAALASKMLRELEQTLSRWAPQERIDFLSPPWAGDFLVTAFGTQSRNQKFGQYLAQGYSIRGALARVGMEVEGYHAAQSLSDKVGPESPILYTLVQILTERYPPERLRDLIELK